MDTSFLLEALARSPNDPASIHPALLNAICLVACCLAGGRLFTFKDYFLKQTRFHLEQSLEQVDRLTHFLWANVIVGNFLTNCGRLEESYAVVSAAARFALACGLHVDGIMTTDINDWTTTTGARLLPAPVGEVEVEDRRRLSHAIYMTDRTLAMLSGLPSVYSTFPAPAAATAAVPHSASTSSATVMLDEHHPSSSRTVSVHHKCLALDMQLRNATV